MAASAQVTPAGAFNYIGADYISSKTAATDVTIQTLAGTEYAAWDMTNEALKVDSILEYTADNGIVIDGVLVKDGAVSAAHDTYLQGDDSSNSPQDIVKINTSDVIEFGSNVTPFTWTSVAAAQQAMDVEVGVDVQAYDAQLDEVAALVPTDNQIMLSSGNSWTLAAEAAVKTALNLEIGTDVQAYSSKLDSYVSGTKETWSFSFAYTEVASFNGGFDYGLPASWADVQTKINQLGANVGNALNTLAGYVYLTSVIDGSGAHKP